MERSKYGTWIVTEEQTKRIVAKDVDAMTQFYNDNYERIRSKAFRFLRLHAPWYCMPSRRREPYRFSIDDMLQQVYVDLPYINYHNTLTIGLSFYRIFYRVDVGGLTSDADPFTLGLSLLDQPVRNGGNATKLDRIATVVGMLPPSAEDAFLLALEEVAAYKKHAHP